MVKLDPELIAAVHAAAEKDRRSVTRYVQIQLENALGLSEPGGRAAPHSPDDDGDDA
jgi:hypothetical protein